MADPVERNSRVHREAPMDPSLPVIVVPRSYESPPSIESKRLPVAPVPVLLPDHISGATAIPRGNPILENKKAPVYSLPRSSLPPARTFGEDMKFFWSFNWWQEASIGERAMGVGLAVLETPVMLVAAAVSVPASVAGASCQGDSLFVIDGGINDDSGVAKDSGSTQVQMNRPPQFRILPEYTAHFDETVTFTLQADDPDGDTLTYSLESILVTATRLGEPPFMIRGFPPLYQQYFNPHTHTFSFPAPNPGSDQTEQFKFGFRVTDGMLSDTTSVIVNVLPPLPHDAGVIQDTGVIIPDAEVRRDAGVVIDSGVRPNTGVPPDSGVRPDSGVPPDSGIPPDSGLCPSPSPPPTDVCAVCDPDGDGIITNRFIDPNFLNAIRYALGKGPNDDITVQDALNTTTLSLFRMNIHSLSGIECFAHLTSLSVGLNQISDLTPLSSLINLRDLDFDSNQISNLSPLSSLVNLTVLGLSSNQISDLTPLSSLVNLTRLSLQYNNRISNLSPLSSLINLGELYLHSSQISDISPLSSLINLRNLDLGNNQISNLSPLSSLINLTILGLASNQISNINPLISNRGLGAGDSVDLWHNPNIPSQQIAVLRARGVRVNWP